MLLFKVRNQNVSFFSGNVQLVDKIGGLLGLSF